MTPVTYKPNPDCEGGMEVHRYGRYVSVAEYNKLKKEVERLTEIIRREVDGGIDLREEAQRTVDENHKLRAENEHLRKIGNEMADCIKEFRSGKHCQAIDKLGGFYVWRKWKDII